MTSTRITGDAKQETQQGKEIRSTTQETEQERWGHHGDEECCMNAGKE